MDQSLEGNETYCLPDGRGMSNPKNPGSVWGSGGQCVFYWLYRPFYPVPSACSCLPLLLSAPQLLAIPLHSHCSQPVSIPFYSSLFCIQFRQLPPSPPAARVPAGGVLRTQETEPLRYQFWHPVPQLSLEAGRNNWRESTSQPWDGTCSVIRKSSESYNFMRTRKCSSLGGGRPTSPKPNSKSLLQAWRTRNSKENISKNFIFTSKTTYFPYTHSQKLMNYFCRN